MKKLYQTSPIPFACIWIGIYTVLMSICDGLSTELGMDKLLSAPAAAILAVVLLIWLKGNGLLSAAGLQKSKEYAKRFLYYIPMFLIILPNLWWGVSVQKSLPEILLYLVTMLFVGFLEELIFRGFLFTALEREVPKYAVLISSLTFGIGHILNLFTGAAPVWETLLQVCYAIAAGWMFTVVYKRSRSLWVCIAAHSLLNMLSAFTPEDLSMAQGIADAVYLCVLPILYTLWICRKEKKAVC